MQELGAREILEQDLLLPGHSTSKGLRTGRREYARRWNNEGCGLSELLERHRDDRGALRRVPVYDIPIGDSTYKMPAKDVRSLRSVLASVGEEFAELDMNEDGKLLAALDNLVGKVRVLAQGEEMKVFRNRPLSRGFRRKASRLYEAGTRSDGPLYDVVVRALGMDPDLPRMRHQLLAQHVLLMGERALELLHQQPNAEILEGFDFRYGSAFSEPPLTLTTMEGYRRISARNAREFLQKFIQHGFADWSQTRSETEQRFRKCVDGSTPFRMGYGEVLAVRKGFGGKVTLRNMAELFERGDLIADPDAADPSTYEMKWYFLSRGGKRKGISDAAGLVQASLVHSNEYGVFGVDVSDGLDAHKEHMLNPFVGSLPVYLAWSFNEKHRRLFGEPLVSDACVSEYVYLAAKGNVAPIGASKSHTRLHHPGNKAEMSVVAALRDQHPEQASIQIGRRWQPLSHITEIVERRLRDFKVHFGELTPAYHG